MPWPMRPVAPTNPVCFHDTNPSRRIPVTNLWVFLAVRLVHGMAFGTGARPEPAPLPLTPGRGMMVG